MANDDIGLIEPDEIAYRLELTPAGAQAHLQRAQGALERFRA
jgi:hypothetical protein